MERGGNNNGGIHGNRKISQTSSYKTAPDINTAKAKNATTDDTECNVREQDRFMPIANIIRIMRQVLPQHAKISDEAKETVQECVSEFIGFITGEANDRCQREQRRTITAEDLLWAMNKLGFDNYIEPLMLYLERYREIDGGERGSARGEPLMRPVDPGSFGLPGYPPAAFHPMAGHYGYSGVYPVNGFVQVPAVGSAPSQVAMTLGGPSQAAMAFAGPSQAAMAFAGSSQAAMAFAGPSQAVVAFIGPSQAVVARAEPFPPGEE